VRARFSIVCCVIKNLCVVVVDEVSMDTKGCLLCCHLCGRLKITVPSYKVNPHHLAKLNCFTTRACTAYLNPCFLWLGRLDEDPKTARVVTAAVRVVMQAVVQDNIREIARQAWCERNHAGKLNGSAGDPLSIRTLRPFATRLNIH
jgi:hypothetical protein